MSECLIVEPYITVRLAWDEEDPEAQLVIPPTCIEESGLWWNSLEHPPFGLRYTYNPPSEYVDGQTLLRAVTDLSTVVMGVAVRGTTVTDLEDQKIILANALAHFPLALLIESEADYGAGPVDEVIGGWKAMPALPTWGAVTPQGYGMLAAQGTVQIPVNPAGSPS